MQLFDPVGRMSLDDVQRTVACKNDRPAVPIYFPLNGLHERRPWAIPAHAQPLILSAHPQGDRHDLISFGLVVSRGRAHQRPQNVYECIQAIGQPGECLSLHLRIR